MPLINHRLSRRFFVKGASAAAAAGALTLQAQAAQADEAPTNIAPATEETKGPRLVIQRATITETGMTVNYTAHGLREFLTEGTTLTVRHGYVRNDSFETLRSWPLTPEFDGDADSFSGSDQFPIELMQGEGVEYALQLDICSDPWGQEITHQIAARIPVAETKILKTSFEDVPGSHPFAEDIRMANQKKWLMPNPQSGAFEPDRPVTREELIALLNHAAGHAGVSENSNVAPFADAAGRPTANALHWARDRKITEPLTGGDKIDPTAPGFSRGAGGCTVPVQCGGSADRDERGCWFSFPRRAGCRYSAPLRCVGWRERYRAGFFGCVQPDRADYSRGVGSFHSPLQAAEPAVH